MILKFLLIFPFLVNLSLAAQEPGFDGSELVVPYNSRNFDESLLDGYSKRELIELIRTNALPEFIKGEKRNQFHIPFGPTFDVTQVASVNDPAAESKEENRSTVKAKIAAFKVSKKNDFLTKFNQSLENLSEDELRTFLSKKYAFLNAWGERSETIFRGMGMAPRYKMIQSILNTLNNSFYLNVEKFIYSNTHGVPVFVRGNLAFSIGKIINEYVIAKTPLRKILKPEYEFLVGGNLGFGVARVKDGNKTAWVLDLFFDLETLKHAYLPVVQGTAGAGSGFYMEGRDIDNFKKRISFSSGGYDYSLYAPVVGHQGGSRSFMKQFALNGVFPMPSTFFETHIRRRAMHFVLKKPQITKCERFYN